MDQSLAIGFQSLDLTFKFFVCCRHGLEVPVFDKSELRELPDGLLRIAGTHIILDLDVTVVFVYFKKLVSFRGIWMLKRIFCVQRLIVLVQGHDVSEHVACPILC